MATKNSARLTRAYTDEQKRACLEAHLVDGLSQAETERRAIAGTLRPDLGPFGRPRFIYTIIAKGRESYEARNPAALDSGSTHELERLTRLALARARELDKDSDPAEIARRAKALAETHRALRGAEGKTRTPKTAEQASKRPAEPTAQSQPDVLASLSALANTRNTPSETVNTPAHPEQEARGPVRSLAS